MTRQQTTGKLGEDLAVKHLLDQGYQIRERNYRQGRYEIDIIAEKGDELVFVEVKTRKSAAYGYPEAFATTGQQERIVVAAQEYASGHNWTGDLRFDIIAILWEAGQWQIEHIRDAF